MQILPPSFNIGRQQGGAGHGDGSQEVESGGGQGVERGGGQGGGGGALGFSPLKAGHLPPTYGPKANGPEAPAQVVQNILFSPSLTAKINIFLIGPSLNSNNSLSNILEYFWGITF